MSDKPKPVEDLKEGLGLLFRAAKGAVDSLPTDKIEDVAKDAAKEVGRAFESLGQEIEKVVGRATGSQPPANVQQQQHQQPPANAQQQQQQQRPVEPPTQASVGQEPKKEEKFDDGYAPEPPKGPRVS